MDYDGCVIQLSFIFFGLILLFQNNSIIYPINNVDAINYQYIFNT
jgi:hypothetical protein